MLTHILYTQRLVRVPLYFSGDYLYNNDVEEITWTWTRDKTKATIFCTTDAWYLWDIARKQWPHANIQIGRLVQLKEILRHEIQWPL